MKKKSSRAKMTKKKKKKRTKWDFFVYDNQRDIKQGHPQS
jgi:hypothetical protein